MKEIEPILKAPRSNEYGRADQAAVWMVLSRLYLNAEVYTGTARWADAATYAKKVMTAGYTLEPVYGDMFRADNNKSQEMIMPICFDGVYARSWSGMFFVCSFISGDMDLEANFGTKEGWGGNRARMALVKKFANDGNLANVKDQRAMFWTKDRTLAIEKPSEFTQGYTVAKFKNLTKDGQIGSDPNKQFPDMDFPLFRLAEANLTFAEATLRAGGSKTEALKAINDLRKRAKATEIGESDLTLNFILDEKSREFYFEAQRRVDLIRFNKYTSDYIWDWKGGVAEGTSLPAHLKLLPIPISQLTANTKLIQNTGY